MKWAECDSRKFILVPDSLPKGSAPIIVYAVVAKRKGGWVIKVPGCLDFLPSEYEEMEKAMSEAVEATERRLLFMWEQFQKEKS